MSNHDRDLGIHRAITRRDFVNGVSIAVGGSLLMPPGLEALGLSAGSAQNPSGSYPPAQTGMRGAHAGSFEIVHALRDGKTWDAGTDTGESHDLIVVGAGMSGLAAAHFFRKAVGPNAKILILDNHDDFGGHAKRNEYRHGDRLMMGFGGTAGLYNPSSYTAEGKTLLSEIGVDLPRFETAYDQKLYASLGLRPAMFFDKETFGVDRLLVGVPSAGRAGAGQTSGTTPQRGSDWRAPAGQEGGGAPAALSWEEFIERTPLSEAAKRDLVRLYTEKRDYLPELTREEKVQRLRKMSYRDYLLNVVKVHRDVVPFFRARSLHNVGLGPDALSAWYWFRSDSPGFDGLGVERPPNPPRDASVYRFPDGGAGVARLLVRSLIPEAVPGRSMADQVTAHVEYSRLDEPGLPVRIRLNSTVVRVRHLEDPATAKEIEITYVRDGQAHRAGGRACILACNNAVVPYLCPELPASQKEALQMAVRIPMVYTNVLIRDWRALDKLGVLSIQSPGAFHSDLGLAIPVSLDTYRHSRTPEEPMVLRLVHTRTRPGLPAREQYRLGRAELFQMPFELFERKTRDQLGRMLSDGGFDPALDIEAITVNRWPDGYAPPVNSLFDPDVPEEDLPFVVGRQRLGRIAIANSDAAGICLTQAAFDQAHRAVQEILHLSFVTAFPFQERI